MHDTYEQITYINEGLMHTELDMVTVAFSQNKINSAEAKQRNAWFTSLRDMTENAMVFVKYTSKDKIK